MKKTILFYIAFISSSILNIYAQHPETTIPFSLSGVAHILIELETENGTKGIFAFDTGLSGIFIDKSFADKAGFSTGGKQSQTTVLQGLGNGYGIEAEIINQVNVKIGDREFSGQQALVGRMPPSSPGYNYDGLIGLGLFKNKILKIDFDKSYIYVYDNTSIEADYRPVESILQVSLQPKNSAAGLGSGDKKYYVSINFQIDNTRQLNSYALFDTGSFHPFIFFNDVSPILSSIIDTYMFEVEVLGGFGGGKTAVCFAKIKSLKFADSEFPNPVINFSKDQKGALTKENMLKMPRAGIMGMDLIKRFNWVIDFKNNKFYSKANTLHDSKSGIKSDSLTYQNIGFVYNNKRPIVAYLIKDQSELGDISVGDIVKSVRIKNSGLNIDVSELINSPKNYYNIPLVVNFLKNNALTEKTITIKREVYHK